MEEGPFAALLTETMGDKQSHFVGESIGLERHLGAFDDTKVAFRPRTESFQGFLVSVAFARRDSTIVVVEFNENRSLL